MAWAEQPLDDDEVAPIATGDADAQQFARYVAYCRRHRAADVIAHLSSDNARIVMGNLLQLAIDEKFDVRLVTGILDQNTYNPLVALFSSVMKGGNKVKIIILSSNLNYFDNQIFHLVSEHSYGRVRLYNEAPASFPHFMLVGDAAYRIELNDTTKESYACFGDKDSLVVSYYRGLFSQKWNEKERGGDADKGPVGAR